MFLSVKKGYFLTHSRTSAAFPDIGLQSIQGDLFQNENLTFPGDPADKSMQVFIVVQNSQGIIGLKDVRGRITEADGN